MPSTAKLSYTECDYLEDTLSHIHHVQQLLSSFAEQLYRRGQAHDLSKLSDPEKSIFHQNTVAFRRHRLGTQAYDRHGKEQVREALRHHYANNSHHPQHYNNGVKGMCLLDIVEMFHDCVAASKDHGETDPYHWVAANQERFGFSDELASIFRNTITHMLS